MIAYVDNHYALFWELGKNSVQIRIGMLIVLVNYQG